MNAAPFALAAALFAAGAILIALAHRVRPRPPDEGRADWTKYGVYLALIAGLLSAAHAGREVMACIVAALVVAGAMEMARAAGPGRVVAWRIAFPAALLLALAWGHMLLGPADAWTGRFAFLLLVTGTTDAFSQIWGMAMGRRKLCPRLSPGKTREGMIGGIASAIAVALCAGFLDAPSGAARRACLGLLIAVAAFAGDLLFSLLKRRAGIKDFSRLLPGHGGILDRFDSMTLAAPVFHWSRLLLAG
jgi:phosphatidate cytidylyltransferase